MYYSCIYSIISYCIIIWGGILQSTRKGLELENIHTKIIENLFAHHINLNECLFKTIKLLKLKDIHILCVGLYMYKIVKLNECPTLQANLDLTQPEHQYNTRSRSNFKLPFPRVENIRVNYKYQFVNIRNKIPNYVKDKNTLNSFKRALKSYLLGKY